LSLRHLSHRISNSLIKVAERILKSEKITEGPRVKDCSGSKTFRFGFQECWQGASWCVDTGCPCFFD